MSDSMSVLTGLVSWCELQGEGRTTTDENRKMTIAIAEHTWGNRTCESETDAALLHRRPAMIL